MAWYLVHDTTFSGTIATQSPWQTLQDGWVDELGNVWSVSGGYAVAQPRASSTSGVLMRPSAEDTVDAQVTVRFVMPTAASSSYFWAVARHTHNPGSSNGYSACVGSTGQIYFASLVNESYTFLGAPPIISGVTGGTSYDLQFTVTQTNSTTTTLTCTLFNTSGTQLGTASVTDTTAVLQNTSGGCGMFLFGPSAASGSLVQRVRTYTDVTAVSNGALSVPYSGSVGQATTFTIAPLWPLGSTTIVTPSSNGDGGTFSPTTLTFPSGSAQSQHFTYTPTTTGTKTISVSNSVSSSNPTPLTWTVLPAPYVIGVSSAAFKFSPGNWKGNVGRGGSIYRQTWNTGAWYSVTWNASASPTASLQLTTSSSGAQVTIYVNGVPYDGFSTTGNISVVGTAIKASASNTLKIMVSYNPMTSRWNNGTNVVQVTGLLVDGGSTAGVAASARPWALLVSDSIGEGYAANAGTENFNYGYFSHLMYLLDTMGYDSCASAVSGSGWLTTGDSGGVPAYYVVSGSTNGTGGTYNDTTSRWNKIDNGVSLLDGAGRISSYGSLNTSPSLILINYMGNDCLRSQNVSDCQASVTQCITALRTAAPSAWIVLIVPFGLYTYTNGTTYVTALKNAVTAYQSAYPSDTKVALYDFGATTSALFGSTIYTYTDGVHQMAAGHGVAAALVASKIGGLLAGTSSTPLPFYTHA